MRSPKITCRKLFAMFAAASFCLAGAFAPLRVSAWDRVSYGTVAALELYGNGSFTVFLAGSPSLCSGPVPGSWNASAGLVSTDNGLTSDGVKAFYATLLAAKLSGRAVRLFVNNNAANPSSVCAVGALSVQD